MWVFGDWILNGGNDLFSGFFFTQIFADLGADFRG
jgi:hypothetical protein